MGPIGLFLADDGLQVRLLGPLAAFDARGPLRLGGPRQRTVLAMLALHANQVVSTDRLVEAVWDAAPPPSADRTLRTYVSHLRKTIDAGRARHRAHLRTQAPGYLLHIHPDAVDALRFERLVADARKALDAGDSSTVSNTLGQALALWRGLALADLADRPFAQPSRTRLEDLRVTAAADQVDADLALGRHGRVVDRLHALVAAHPLRERLAGQRMLALYRCGRQADALRAYREARDTLIDGLGVEPGPTLRRLHTAILRQDPALDMGPFGLDPGIAGLRPGAPARPGSRRR